MDPGGDAVVKIKLPFCNLYSNGNGRSSTLDEYMIQYIFYYIIIVRTAEKLKVVGGTGIAEW